MYKFCTPVHRSKFKILQRFVTLLCMFYFKYRKRCSFSCILYQIRHFFADNHLMSFLNRNSTQLFIKFSKPVDFLWNLWNNSKVWQKKIGRYGRIKPSLRWWVYRVNKYLSGRAAYCEWKTVYGSCRASRSWRASHPNEGDGNCSALRTPFLCTAPCSWVYPYVYSKPRLERGFLMSNFFLSCF